jgi:hypothetical protein
LLCRFSDGIEFASLVTSSGILCKTWTTISSHNEDIVSNNGAGLSWKIDRKPGSDFTILAFKATLDDFSNLQADFVSSSELKEDNFIDFQFLCSRKFPIFSLNKTAISLFRQNHDKLDRLKSQVHK